MLIIHCGGPHPIWEPKDYLHPIRSIKISIECKMERMMTPPLCDDVVYIESYEDWLRHYTDYSEVQRIRDSLNEDKVE